MFTFQILIDKIDQNTNLAKLYSAKCFFGITVNSIIQKLKIKHLVRLSFLWWEVFWEKEWKYFANIPGQFGIKNQKLLALYILSYFPGIRNLRSPNDLEQMCDLKLQFETDSNDHNLSKRLYFLVRKLLRFKFQVGRSD